MPPRTARLATVTPLTRTGTPQRVAGLRPRRRRHMATGRPAAREDLTRRQRSTLHARADGCCEWCGGPVPRGAFEAAHRQARGQGGHNAALYNRWVAHSDCHRWQHNHPTAAAETGHYVRSGLDPRRMPMCLPDGRVVRLTAAGGYDTGFEPAGGDAA